MSCARDYESTLWVLIGWYNQYSDIVAYFISSERKRNVNVKRKVPHFWYISDDFSNSKTPLRDSPKQWTNFSWGGNIFAWGEVRECFCLGLCLLWIYVGIKSGDICLGFWIYFAWGCDFGRNCLGKDFWPPFCLAWRFWQLFCSGYCLGWICMGLWNRGVLKKFWYSGIWSTCAK